MIYLASQSPRRAELLTQIGVPFETLILPADYAVDEVHVANELPIEFVERLSIEKARAGLKFIEDKHMPTAPVMGADTIVVCDDHILGKPKDKADAERMLNVLSDKTHFVYTGVTVITEQTCWSAVSCTKVTMKRLVPKEIEQYWNTGEPVGKAGAYAIQGHAGVFIEWIEGSFSNVVGLPLFETKQLLDRVNVPVWQCEHE